MKTRANLISPIFTFPFTGLINPTKRKNFLLLIVLCFITITNGFAQNWKATGALAATNSSFYLTGATNVGNDIFAVNADQTMVYSTDLGLTWSAPAATKLKGNYAYILGIENRLYASTKLNAYDHELNYSTDRGATWMPDTVGLPQSPTKTGKSGMLLKYMGNGYMLAHNYLKAFYKKIEETNWNPTTIDFAIVDVAATKDKWLAIGAGKILQSTNNGASWNIITTNGLPAGFQGALICTNGSRIYISNAPADGGDKIYYSEDGGVNWTLSNSSGKFTFSNPWVQTMYAVDDYLFASIKPANIQDSPPFIVSSTKQPNFSVGDVSGLPTGRTNSHLPFFFHIGDKLFTMFWDLYSSEPGFSSSTTAVQRNLMENESISVYPNPSSYSIRLKTNNAELEGFEIFNIRGQKIFTQVGTEQNPIDISGWSNGIYLVKTISKEGISSQTKFIKN